MPAKEIIPHLRQRSLSLLITCTRILILQLQMALPEGAGGFSPLKNGRKSRPLGLD
jgi:hypothetical protein